MYVLVTAGRESNHSLPSRSTSIHIFSLDLASTPNLGMSVGLSWRKIPHTYSFHFPFPCVPWVPTGPLSRWLRRKGTNRPNPHPPPPPPKKPHAQL